MRLQVQSRGQFYQLPISTRSEILHWVTDTFMMKPWLTVEELVLYTPREVLVDIEEVLVDITHMDGSRAVVRVRLRDIYRQVQKEELKVFDLPDQGDE